MTTKVTVTANVNISYGELCVNAGETFELDAYLVQKFTDNCWIIGDNTADPILNGMTIGDDCMLIEKVCY